MAVPFARALPLLITCALAAVPAAAWAQGGATVGAPMVADASCRIIPDTAKGPTPGQVNERKKLRDDITAVARRHGVQDAQGILYLDVDSTRKGKVLVLDSNLGQPAVDEATRLLEDYLYTLPPGRGYRALVRVDGEYPAMLPGRRHCLPEFQGHQELVDMVGEVLRRHPEKNRPPAQNAVLRLVVNREGGVSYAEVEQPTGDPFIDQHLEAIGRRLRFRPATLDGTPFDVRFRFTVPLFKD